MTSKGEIFGYCLFILYRCILDKVLSFVISAFLATVDTWWCNMNLLLKQVETNDYFSQIKKKSMDF